MCHVFFYAVSAYRYIQEGTGVSVCIGVYVGVYVCTCMRVCMRLCCF